MAKRKVSGTKKELARLEADAARWVVSLATYLRIALFLKENVPYQASSNLSKALLEHEQHLNTFETTGYLHPELGYAVFKYLERHKKNEPLAKIFTMSMSAPKGGTPSSYWRPTGAIGVKDVAYQPWTTQQHATLLKEYQLNQKEKEVLAYHLRGPLDNDPRSLEGIEPIYRQILILKTQYTFETGEEYKAHQHTDMLPAMVDLLNEYLAIDNAVASSDVWLQKFRGKKLPPRGNPFRANPYTLDILGMDPIKLPSLEAVAITIKDMGEKWDGNRVCVWKEDKYYLDPVERHQLSEWLS